YHRYPHSLPTRRSSDLPLSQNKYFWSHNKSVQINDKMAAIREAHPAFFKISYDDYYETHVRTLEEWIQAIERKGQIVANLTPSQDRKSTRLNSSHVKIS